MAEQNCELWQKFVYKINLIDQQAHLKLCFTLLLLIRGWFNKFSDFYLCICFLPFWPFCFYKVSVFLKLNASGDRLSQRFFSHCWLLEWSSWYALDEGENFVHIERLPLFVWERIFFAGWSVLLRQQGL